MNNRLILLRKNLQLSQAKLAEDLNLSRTFINLVENGNRELSDRTVADICRIYNVSESWLRTGKGDMFKPKDRETEVAEIAKKLLKAEPDDYVAKLIKSLALLDLDDWRELNRIIKKLVKEQEKDSSNN